MDVLQHLGEVISLRIDPTLLLMGWIAWQLHKRTVKLEDDVDKLQMDAATVVATIKGIKPGAI